jgi:hypothetical protein
MPSQNLSVLRHTIENTRPKKCLLEDSLKKPVTHGWLLPYLLATDDFLWRRWNHWYELMLAGAVQDSVIPPIEWCSHGSPVARKMLERTLDCITKHGCWKGWSSWTYFNFLMDWLLFSFGHPAYAIPPQEPAGAEGACWRLYQVFNLETLLAYPYDYFGDILAENHHGRRAGFFPTPMPVVELMARMTVGDEDARKKTICDPCVGTGRMLLAASNFSYRLYGCDIDSTVIKATLVNGYLYAPWLVKPFPFLDAANLDKAQGPKISDSLANNKPEYYRNTIADPEGHRYAPLKRRVRRQAVS